LVDHGGHAVLVLFWKSFEIRRFHDCCPFLILLLLLLLSSSSSLLSSLLRTQKLPKLNKASDVTDATTKERKNETEAADKTLNTRTEEKP
jgi:hypothetical protein